MTWFRPIQIYIWGWIKWFKIVVAKVSIKILFNENSWFALFQSKWRTLLKKVTIVRFETHECTIYFQSIFSLFYLVYTVQKSWFKHIFFYCVNLKFFERLLRYFEWSFMFNYTVKKLFTHEYFSFTLNSLRCSAF